MSGLVSASLGAFQKRIPILRLSPGLKILEGNIGELTMERNAVHSKADPVEPLVHLDGIFTHALPNEIEPPL